MADFNDVTSSVVAGAAAGDITVTGIKKYDILILVQDLTTGANLSSEFTVTADDTINNTGGTSTAGHATIVVWEKHYDGGRHKFEAASGYRTGRYPV